MGRKKEALVAKDTFWNQLRLGQGYTLVSLGDELKIDPSQLCKYFNGQVLPTTPIAVKICDKFGIDYITGAEEFNKLHEEWCKLNKGKGKNRSKIHKRGFDFSAPHQVTVDKYSEDIDITFDDDISLESFNIPAEPAASDVNIAELVYGKVPLDKFLAISSGTLARSDVLRTLYGVLPYDVYLSVYNMT